MKQRIAIVPAAFQALLLSNRREFGLAGTMAIDEPPTRPG
jgi:hypothetical protein